MVRVRFIKYRQSKFLEELMRRTDLNSEQAARLCNVCSRTFRDWKRGKYQMSYDTLSKLCRVSRIPMPKNIKTLPEFWSTRKAASLGGKRRFELYGPPGTIESRRKGGINSSRKFLLNPEWAKKRGFVVRKEITYPDNSELLAEFIGILYGDGGVTNYQVTVTFNKLIDKPYADFMVRLIKRLFSIVPSINYRRIENTGNVVISSSNVVELLKQHGIKVGDKTKWGKAPEWIWQNRLYQAAYLRGLMDTDGCVYHHKYKVNGKWYSFTKIAFTSYSAPLRETIFHMLKNLIFSPKLYGNRVYLYKRAEVDRYFKEIGTNNPRYLERYNRFSVTPINTIG